MELLEGAGVNGEGAGGGTGGTVTVEENVIDIVFR